MEEKVRRMSGHIRELEGNKEELLSKYFVIES